MKNILICASLVLVTVACLELKQVSVRSQSADVKTPIPKLFARLHVGDMVGANYHSSGILIFQNEADLDGKEPQLFKILEIHPDVLILQEKDQGAATEVRIPLHQISAVKYTPKN
ncbi:MAG: hypothetical protein JWN70_606 [Planctomycetaceae bacterium]|nr:hypothetical protein [Planctomycetaceae bacterium]